MLVKGYKISVRKFKGAIVGIGSYIQRSIVQQQSDYLAHAKSPTIEKIKNESMPSVVTHAYNPSIREAEVGQP